MIVARVRCKNITIEAAIKETLPHHCKQPELIGQDQLSKVRAEAEAILSGKARRRGMKPAG